MKLYSDTLTLEDIRAAAETAGCYVWECHSIRRARVRRFGWELYLHGSSPHRSQATGVEAATWDEHGVFMAELYKRDPGLRVAFYRDLAHFIAHTTRARDSIYNRELPESRRVRAPWLKDRKLIRLAAKGA